MHKKVLIFMAMLAIFTSCSAQSNSYTTVSITELPSILDTMKEGSYEVIDVRTAEEFAAGAIEGAINIDVLSDDFEENIKQLSGNKQYLVYCQSGRRSRLACEKMGNLLTDSLLNLDGGYLKWQKVNNQSNHKIEK
jgi:rhodanese-related sulfurtransferase